MSGLVRYADDEERMLRHAEFRVDFAQLKFAMTRVFKMIDHAILRAGTRGKPPIKSK